MLLSCCSSRVYKTPFICHINLSQDVKIDNRICRFVHAHGVSLTVCCLHQSGGEGSADSGIGVIVNSLGMFPLKSTHTSSLEPNALLLLLLLVSLQAVRIISFSLLTKDTNCSSRAFVARTVLFTSKNVQYLLLKVGIPERPDVWITG